MATRNTSGSFTATGTSTPVGPRGDSMDLSISGTFVGTIVLQRSHDDGATWNDVTDGSFTAAVEKPILTASPAFDYRLSYTHTSGTVVYYLGTK